MNNTAIAQENETESTPQTAQTQRGQAPDTGDDLSTASTPSTTAQLRQSAIENQRAPENTTLSELNASANQLIEAVTSHYGEYADADVAETQANKVREALNALDNLARTGEANPETVTEQLNIIRGVESQLREDRVEARKSELLEERGYYATEWDASKYADNDKTAGGYAKVSQITVATDENVEFKVEWNDDYRLCNGLHQSREMQDTITQDEIMERGKEIELGDGRTAYRYRPTYSDWTGDKAEYRTQQGSWNGNATYWMTLNEDGTKSFQIVQDKEDVSAQHSFEIASRSPDAKEGQTAKWNFKAGSEIHTYQGDPKNAANDTQHFTVDDAEITQVLEVQEVYYALDRKLSANAAQDKAEQAARIAEDKKLAEADTTETTAREAADKKLTEADITESTAREAADKKLTEADTTETTAREAADKKLAEADITESTAREATDKKLAEADTTETTAREAADKKLAEADTTESTAREAADKKLAEADITESTAREAADEKLQGALDTDTEQDKLLKAQLDTQQKLLEAMQKQMALLQQQNQELEFKINVDANKVRTDEVTALIQGLPGGAINNAGILTISTGSSEVHFQQNTTGSWQYSTDIPTAVDAVWNSPSELDALNANPDDISQVDKLLKVMQGYNTMKTQADLDAARKAAE